MAHHFIIDRLDVTNVKNKLGKSMKAARPHMSKIQASLHARKFLVPQDTQIYINELFNDHSELWLDQRRFAKPPFDPIYIEYPVLEDPDEYVSIGMLWAGNTIYYFTQDHLNHEVGWADFTVVVGEEGFHVSFILPSDKNPSEEDADMARTVLKFAARTELLFLLMHQPTVVNVASKPASSIPTPTGIVNFKAHSVVTIDLKGRRQVEKVFRLGTHASPVEHMVRGTWVHYHTSRACAHEWAKTETEPDRPERFSCPLCGGLRVWRHDHVRGDAPKGTTLHSYEVVH